MILFVKNDLSSLKVREVNHLNLDFLFKNLDFLDRRELLEVFLDEIGIASCGLSVQFRTNWQPATGNWQPTPQTLFYPLLRQIIALFQHFSGLINHN